ncbi:MAG TPA: hypothetical protein VE052_08050, partial [Gemmatimonadaceae bacterium]|nr:hypothetical protein [Gemmatimonadaceae bacterium]
GESLGRDSAVAGGGRSDAAALLKTPEFGPRGDEMVMVLTLDPPSWAGELRVGLGGARNEWRNART